MRVVRTPDHRMILDASGRVPGRGAYLCADGACWSAALKKGAIERALGEPLPEELRAQLTDPQTTLTAGGTRGT